MSKTISTRVPEETAEQLEEIAEEEHLDRASLVRKMLAADIEEYRIETAAERYRKGDASIEAAADEAGVSVWRMIEYVERENIRPPAQDVESLESEFTEAIG